MKTNLIILLVPVMMDGVVMVKLTIMMTKAPHDKAHNKNDCNKHDTYDNNFGVLTCTCGNDDENGNENSECDTIINTYDNNN